MAFGSLIEDAQGTPIPQVYIPGVGFKALKGSTATYTDGSGNESTSVAFSGDFKEVAALTAGSLNVDLVTSTDVSFFKSFGIQMTGTWVGTLSFQGSNNNSDWNEIFCWSPNNTQPITSSTVNGLYTGSIYYKYLRIHMTSYTSGTANGVLMLFAYPISPTNFYGFVSQNGTWNIQRGPGNDITLLSSAARTASLSTSDQTNNSGRGVRVVLDVTSAGTGSITLSIEAKDGASGKYVALLTGAAVVTNSTNVYVVYPGLTPVAMSIASDVVPRTWRVTVTHNNANSITYSVGASMLV